VRLLLFCNSYLGNVAVGECSCMLYLTIKRDGDILTTVR